MGFVFMSVSLFNLIVVHERAVMGPAFNWATDRYVKNIIRRGAVRCFVFQIGVGLVSAFLNSRESIRKNSTAGIFPAAA